MIDFTTNNLLHRLIHDDNFYNSYVKDILRDFQCDDYSMMNTTYTDGVKLLANLIWYRETRDITNYTDWHVCSIFTGMTIENAIKILDDAIVNGFEFKWEKGTLFFRECVYDDGYME